jgi:AcrR family transcriptional regulator
VSKQTIYRWWPSKAAIIVDVWAEVIAPRVAFPDTGDLEADLRAQLTRMLDVLAEPVPGLNYMAVIADSQRDEGLAADLSARIFDLHWPRWPTAREPAASMVPGFYFSIATDCHRARDIKRQFFPSHTI